MQTSLQINFGNREGGFLDNYWLRMEVVELVDGKMTVGEAADLIDALYDTSVCGQTEPTPPVEEGEKPSGEDWNRALLSFGALPTCDAYKAMGLDTPGAYEADIKVYRSHQYELYKLILSNGTASGAVRTSERVELTLDIEAQTHITLDTPIVSRPHISWLDVDGPIIHITGNTLWWEGVVTGTIRAEFYTVYDLVHINVTGVDTPQQVITGSVDENWLGVGWYSGSETGEELTDIQDIECSVLAFYHYQYEELLLNRPETDESVSVADQGAVCVQVSSVSVEPYEPFEPGEWTPAKCEESCNNIYASGSSSLADCLERCHRVCYQTIEHDAICSCGGATETVTEESPVPCPDGYTTGSSVDGGEVKQVDAKYVNCGTDDVNTGPFYEQHCCQEVPDGLLLPACEELHEPFTNKEQTEEQKNDVKEAYGANAKIIPVAPKEGKCGEKVTTQNIDSAGCCEAVTPVSIPEDDRVMAPESEKVIIALNGLQPLEWSASGGLSVKGSEGQQVIVESDASFCGNGEVTVTDACGNTDSCSIRSTIGHWVAIPFEPCNSPYTTVYDGGDFQSGNFIKEGLRIYWGTQSSGQCVEAGMTCPGNEISIGSLQAYCTAWAGAAGVYSGGCCHVSETTAAAMAQQLTHLFEWQC